MPKVLKINTTDEDMLNNSRGALVMSTVFYCIMVIVFGFCFCKIQNEETLKKSFHVEFENRKNFLKEDKID